MQLVRVEISNFALAEHVVFEPCSGLTVLTGETGAGKSILIDALEFLCGERSDRAMLRTGAEEAVLHAVFQGDTPESEWIFTRGLQENGRSYARMNDQPVTARRLRECSEDLIAIHSQNDQQTIFRDSHHRELVDAYGGAELAHVRDVYRTLRDDIYDIDHELASLGDDPQTRAERLSLIDYQIEEIERSELRIDEEDELERKIRMMTALGELASCFNVALETLTPSNDEGALVSLADARRALEKGGRLSGKCREFAEIMGQIEHELDELVYRIERAAEKVVFDPFELDRAEKRFSFIQTLKEKYNGDVSDIIDRLERLKERRAFLVGSENRWCELSEMRKQRMAELAEAAERLAALRADSGRKLSEAIIRELQSLNLKHARFAVGIDQVEISTNPPNDPQHVYFLFSANPGEAMLPLVSIASGGEASRILLAVKTVLAEVDHTSVLVFDEIDTGISGDTTKRVAEKLRHIAKTHQVLCVTHSAQIAAAADCHLMIQKKVVDGRTLSELSALNDRERVTEVARLLTGEPNEAEARHLARSLLQTRRLGDI